MERELATIESVSIVIATGRDSQTVKVCDLGNVEGIYRAIYRSRQQNMWVSKLQLERDVVELKDLEGYLIKRGYIRER